MKLSTEVVSTGWTEQPGRWANDRLGVEIIHVQVLKDDGTPAYDQPIIHERFGGEISLPIDEIGRIGFVRQFRHAVAADPAEISYPLAPEQIEKLGAWSWELPRGFPKGQELETGVREMEEETQIAAVSSFLLGRVNVNTAFYVGRIGVRVVRVDRSRKSEIPPDQFEKIDAVQWVSKTDIYGKIAQGEILCGLTLASLALYWATC